MGIVYLVGAGPGDAGLITVKGLKKLRQCDAVVYDRLASEELLDYVQKDCTKIYVGKQAGKHSKKQEEINAILVECAKKYSTVVRLKGGDPFVFGRGGEEIEALVEHGIAYEVIPGITSAVAVPECAGIPVTHRGISRSFHVITGHTQTSVGSPEYDYETLAKNEGTLVFLMGLSNLEEIATHLVQAGKAGSTPAAVISEGTTGKHRTNRGPLTDIPEKVRGAGLSSPAVIVIGETAGYEYRCPAKHGTRVGIIATDLLRRKLERGLEGLGMQPVSLCDMQVVPTEQMKELEEEFDNLHTYQWVMFTSQNAVRLFFEAMKRCRIDIRKLGNLRFAVLGSGTADRLAEYGIQADFIPSRYEACVLAEEFADNVDPDTKVLIPRAVQGSKELTAILSEHQIAYRDILIYNVEGNLTENIENLDTLDVLVFVSASGVTSFFQEIRKRNLILPENIRIACIGSITRNRLQQEYGEADVVAAVSDVEGLLDAMQKEL